MADIQLTTENDFRNLDTNEIDRVLIPAGSRGNDFLANFRRVDQLDITEIEETAEELLAGAIPLDDQRAVRLSGSFGQLTLDGITLAELTPENFIKRNPDAPIVGDDPVTGTGNITVAVLANDSDPNGDPLAIVGDFPITTENNGTVTIDDNGTADDTTDDRLIYQPAAGFSGTDSFTYTVSDGENTGTGTVVVTVEGVENIDPIALPDVAETIANESVVVDVTANDFDLDGNTFDVTGTSETDAGGTVEIGADNQVTYIPPTDFVGPDSFTYTITDEAGGTGTATVSVIVAPPENEAPIAADDTALTTEGIAVVIGVLDNDSDPDNGPEPLFISNFQDVAENGTIALDGLNIVYTPDDGFAGTETFSYTVSDGLDTDTATVTVTVEPENEPPVAADDTALTTEGISVAIAVLNNDSDPDNGPEELSITGPSETAEGGTVIINDSTVVLYTPPEVSETITDSFTYTISDGDLTDTATVTVTVAPDNQPPVADDDTADATQGLSVGIAVLDNDSDPDGDPLSISGISAQSTNGGTLSIGSNGTPLNPSDDVVVYTSAPDFTGTDSFTYTIADGNGGTDSATVTVSVVDDNLAPIASDDSFTTNQGVAIAIDILPNDFDPNGDPINIVGRPENTANGGTITLDRNGTFLDQTDDFLAYTPAATFVGTDSFTYTISDGALTDTATVTIVVEGEPNVAPIAADDTALTTENTPVSIPIAALLENDSDPDGDTLSLIEVGDFVNGSASINGDQVIFTPEPDAVGQASFNYSISDGRGGTASATVNVTLSPEENLPPDAVDDTATTMEDMEVAIPVLANDSDPNGNNTFSIAGVSQGANGSVTDSVGQVIYTPDTDFFGTDSFTYSISDGEFTDSATVTVTVTPVNDAPVAVDDATITNEGVPATIAVLTNDSDVDNADLSITVGSPGNGTAVVSGDDVVYTPDAGFSGTDSFTYTIDDGQGGSDTATVTVEVDAVNDPPIAEDDTTITDEEVSVTIAVLGNDSDPEGATISITQIQDPPNGTVEETADGELIYTPDPDFAGTDSFAYTISDGVFPDSATVTVTVNPVNDPPVAVDDTETTSEDTEVAIAVLANDTDVDGDQLSITQAGTPALRANNGTVSISGDEVIYTPDPDFFGTDSFTYSISDGSVDGTSSATVTVTVEPVNDPPVAVDDTQTTTEDTAVDIAVLGNDSDPDGGTLSIESVSTPNSGTAVIDGENVTYTPDADFFGTDSFTYVLSDSQGGTDTATVTVTVDPVNDAPVAVDDSFTATEEVPGTIAVLNNDSDPDGDAFSITGTSTPNNGTLDIFDNGTPDDASDDEIVYTSEVDFFGTDSFTYTISDPQGETATATVTVTVEDANEDPIAVPDATITTQFIPVAIDVLENDSDADGGILSIQDVGTPTDNGGTVSIFDNDTPETTDDQVVYTPDDTFSGTDSFSYTISDGQGGTASALVTVTVEGNPRPVASDDNVTVTADGSTNIPVLSNDSDPEGEPFSLFDVANPPNGNTEIVGEEIVYTPDAGATADSFTYTIIDSRGATATAEVTVDIVAQIIPTDGDDLILGNNLLDSETGLREEIEGGDGDDTIIGGRGSDILTGGTGADEFVYTSLADSGADPEATTEGSDDILDFNPAEGDIIRLNFDVASGTPVTDADVEINLDFINFGVVTLGLSTADTPPDFLPEQFALRLSNVDPATTEQDIRDALRFGAL